MTKTNAVRILEAAGVKHSVHEYDISNGKIDGVSVAAKCGRPPGISLSAQRAFFPAQIALLQVRLFFLHQRPFLLAGRSTAM
jgi:hypothetical protein